LAYVVHVVRVVVVRVVVGSTLIRRSTTTKASNISWRSRVLVVGRLRRHSIAVRLAIRIPSEAAVTLLLTIVAAELANVVHVVRVIVVRVVVWVTAMLGLLVVTLVMALRSRARRKLVASSRVGSVVTWLDGGGCRFGTGIT
jgi:hypothetical protein